MESSQKMEDCLKLLRGEKDDQVLAGLLLATKFCQQDDKDSILKVYNAVGTRFLNRLLKTGMPQGTGGDEVSEVKQAYLKLSVTILAAFCRVPEIASSEDMMTKVPLIFEVISRVSDPLIYEECYEIILLVGTASKDGMDRLYKSGVMNVLASQISTLHDGSRLLELVLKLLQLLTTQLHVDMINTNHPSEISLMVVAIARQFFVLESGLKFDALHLLTTILSSPSSVALEDLRLTSDINWPSYIRVGILAILQSRVVSSEKVQALALADSMMSIIDEKWLLGPNTLPGVQDPMPIDKCLLLVLESSMIEVAVLLNELAYLKYEANDNSSYAEPFTVKQHNLAVSLAVIEKIIKLISSISEDEGDILCENTIIKAINGLNETISLVLDFLCDAKDHGQKKGDDLLALVRLLGSYLAETPSACKEKVLSLLSYILSVEGADEKRPFYSICFMIPMLCQTTMDLEGSRALVLIMGHKIVADCLVKVIELSGHMSEDNGTAILACNTILNLLFNRQVVLNDLDDSWVGPLLRALAIWADKKDVQSVGMLVSSICSLIFDLTSEEVLLKLCNFDQDTIIRLSKLIAKSWDASNQMEADMDTYGNHDLHQIVVKGYDQWSERFPLVKKDVERIKDR